MGEPTRVISMGFLWGQVVHKHNWGELTHLNDSWVVHHQEGYNIAIPHIFGSKQAPQAQIDEVKQTIFSLAKTHHFQTHAGMGRPSVWEVNIHFFTNLF